MDAQAPRGIALGDLQFDALSGELLRDGAVHRLRPQSAAVLSQLLAHAGQVVSRDQLAQAVWGEVLVTDNSLAQCVTEIRRALGPTREAWLRTLARRGYQLDLPPAAPVAAPAGVDALALPQAPRRWAKTAAWAAAVAAGLIAAAAWLWPDTGLAPSADLSLAVLPLAVSGPDPGTTWFAEVVGEDLSFNLSRIPGARVISYATTQTFAGRAIDAHDIARQLGVRHLLTGSVERADDRVTLRLQLTDTSDGSLRWGERVDTPMADLALAERNVANRVTHALHVKLVDDAATSARAAPHVHPQATDLALQAWAAWNRGTPADVTRAHDLAQDALALDDQSVLAWKTMASWHLRARNNQSMPAEQAVAGAEAAAERARAIDPDHPLVHTVWGASQVLRGRYGLGIAALEHEIQSNPSHPVAYSYLGMAHLMQGEPQKAVQRYQEALAISPRDPRLSRFERHLALAYLHSGDPAAALMHARRATQAAFVDRAAWPMLAAACAAAGDAPCMNDALAGLRKAWPGVNLAAVESEWPPPTAAFQQQHQRFVQGLGQALAQL